MKGIKVKAAALLLCMTLALPAMGQFNLKKAVGGAVKGVEAMTLTDEQMAAYVRESVDWMDKHNPVLGDDSPYVQRLKRLTEGLTSVEGIPLNFKVYDVIDVNAFACADGSVRVFSSLMDIMDDDELLGVIGHEIGHVAKKHSKKAFKTALLASAGKDMVSSAGGVAGALTDSQLGNIAETLLNSKYSQKQEKEADEYGYDFLKSNGKNPWAMSLAFSKLQQLEQQGGATQSKMAKMFSSHPDTASRIKRMEERAKKDNFPNPREN